MAHEWVLALPLCPAGQTFAQATPIPLAQLGQSDRDALSWGFNPTILTVANFSDDKSALDALRTQHEALLAEVGKVIVGQDAVIREVTTAIFAGGHILLVGVPGLAKTLLVNTVAQALGLSFNRIQFTPDLMPSDIVGAEILAESRQFKFVKGPLFSNLVLADEINRTPPKTQAALLEAMQERSVTAAGPP